MAHMRGSTGIGRLDSFLYAAIHDLTKGYRVSLSENARNGYLLRVVEWRPSVSRKEARVEITTTDLKTAGYHGDGIARMLADKAQDCIDHIAGKCILHPDCRACPAHEKSMRKTRDRCARCQAHIAVGIGCMAQRRELGSKPVEGRNG